MPPITIAQGNEHRARMSFLTWSSEHSVPVSTDSAKCSTVRANTPAHETGVPVGRLFGRNRRNQKIRRRFIQRTSQDERFGPTTVGPDDKMRSFSFNDSRTLFEIVAAQFVPSSELGTTKWPFNKCKCKSLKEFWGERRDLNPRPSVPQTDALPAELRSPPIETKVFSCLPVRQFLHTFCIMRFSKGPEFSSAYRKHYRPRH
jgi:hypothetical protein